MAIYAVALLFFLVSRYGVQSSESGGVSGTGLGMPVTLEVLVQTIANCVAAYRAATKD